MFFLFYANMCYFCALETRYCLKYVGVVGFAEFLFGNKTETYLFEFQFFT